jgi:hypothetical protein
VAFRFGSTPSTAVVEFQNFEVPAMALATGEDFEGKRSTTTHAFFHAEDVTAWL